MNRVGRSTRIKEEENIIPPKLRSVSRITMLSEKRRWEGGLGQRERDSPLWLPARRNAAIARMMPKMS
mgnify:CR=1 FL=1